MPELETKTVYLNPATADKKRIANDMLRYLKGNWIRGCRNCNYNMDNINHSVVVVEDFISTYLDNT